MLGLLVDRPLMLTRYPNGVQDEGFYEKDAPAGTPGWVKTFRNYSESARRELNYIVCDNLDTLVWLGNLASLEIHMTLSKVEAFDRPDLVVFDLDPKAPAGYDDEVVTEPSKKESPGKVYVDYVQNSHGRTMVCPYSLRATELATVSTPLAWR